MFWNKPCADIRWDARELLRFEIKEGRKRAAIRKTSARVPQLIKERVDASFQSCASQIGGVLEKPTN